MRRNDTVAGVSGRIVDRIGSTIRRSAAGIGLALGAFYESPSPPPSSRRKSGAAAPEGDGPPIRWRKGELLGCGAFGQVYMGLNVDSGELLAVKQVLIGSSNGTHENAQSHVKELEEEVSLLKKLSHPNIVRYIGTMREGETLNILLEFVPGGSIQSLLGKFGPFPELVVRKYTRQLLQGLQYLHSNGIIHRDIKGANILVDITGFIKLTDFGASKQVFKLATANAAKTMKGTPFWMAPEVIDGSGHSFFADIWSVGCTVIEMATGKPPWSQQYEEVASLLFHVGTTKSHPPIPENLSQDAKDFLLKCLHKEPDLRTTAADLLQHPFVNVGDPNPSLRALQEPPKEAMGHITATTNKSNICSPKPSTSRPMRDTVYEDDLCPLYKKERFPSVGLSFNPMNEPMDDDWPCKLETSPEHKDCNLNYCYVPPKDEMMCGQSVDYEFTLPGEGSPDGDYEQVESKIKAFLEEKAMDLKKLQTPLFKELYDRNDTPTSQGGNSMSHGAAATNLRLPPRAKSSPKTGSGASGQYAETADSPEICSKRVSRGYADNNRILKDISHSQLNEWGDAVRVDVPMSSSPGYAERQRKWKEELDQELKQQREMRQSKKRERNHK